MVTSVGVAELFFARGFREVPPTPKETEPKTARTSFGRHMTSVDQIVVPRVTDWQHLNLVDCP